MINCFEEFEERYGSDEAADVLSLVCETYYAARCQTTKREVDKPVWIGSSESLDREGANHRFSGEVRYRARLYEFTIQDGNWDGTVVEEWSRCYHYGGIKVPRQSHWMFQPVRTMAAFAIMNLGYEKWDEQRWLTDGFGPRLSIRDVYKSFHRI